MGFDKKVIGVLALAAAVVYVVAPGWFSVASLPLLLILVVCPLSMVLMMKMMMPGSSNADTTRSGSGDEVAALREEIDLLRAEQGMRDRRSGEAL